MFNKENINLNWCKGMHRQRTEGKLNIDAMGRE